MDAGDARTRSPAGETGAKKEEGVCVVESSLFTLRISLVVAGCLKMMGALQHDGLGCSLLLCVGRPNESGIEIERKLMDDRLGTHHPVRRLLPRPVRLPFLVPLLPCLLLLC
jgi:hypothetical protein